MLTRNPGIGLESTSRSLRFALNVADENDDLVFGEELTTRGKGWRLILWDNGNAGSFRRERSKDAMGIDPASGPTREQIVAGALDVIQSTLSDVITLAKNERLVVLSVRGEFGGTQSNEAGSRREELLDGWEATFGRSIDGHLVLGGGSHVRVGFDARGELEDLHFDWPSYSAIAETVLTAAPEVVAERVARQRNVPRGLRLETETTECGFVDHGAKRKSKRTPFPKVAPGCFVKSLMVTADLAPGNSESSGIIRFVSSLAKEEPATDSQGVPAPENRP